MGNVVQSLATHVATLISTLTSPTNSTAQLEQSSSPSIPLAPFKLASNVSLQSLFEDELNIEQRVLSHIEAVVAHVNVLQIQARYRVDHGGVGGNVWVGWVDVDLGRLQSALKKRRQ